MEKFIFIHGSASGQSSLPLNENASRLCGEVGKWYFEGRENRILGVPSCFMAIELFSSSDGKKYCMYSYVHNECYGPAPDLRLGQYFAVTIALKEHFCIQPSSVFVILSGAYNQLIKNKIIAEKINSNGKEYKGVYQIGQFKDREAYLIDFLNKISSFFERDCTPICKELPKSVNLPLPWNGKPMTKVVNNRAERIPWNGNTVHPSECDSQVVMDMLWKDGRLYISEEASLANDHINKLQIENQKLEQKAKALQEKIDNPVVNPKTKQEIAALKAEIEKQKKEAELLTSENAKLLQDNKDLLDTYDGLTQVINKYKNKTSKQLSTLNKNVANDVTKTKTWRRWIKAVFLLLILIFSLISLLFNIHFFRNLSSNYDETEGQKQKIAELSQRVDFINRNMTNMPLSQTTVDAPSEPIITSSQLSQPVTTVIPTTPSPQNPDFGLTITDEFGQHLSSVNPGQKIKAKVSKPKDGSSFTSAGATKVSEENNTATFTVTTDTKAKEITIGYGASGNKNQKKRQRITLKINNSVSNQELETNEDKKGE